MSPIGRIAIVGALACLASAGIVPPARVQEVDWPTHGWRRSSPEAQGMDSRVLADAFDYVRQQRIPIHSLTIVRNGYMVLDAYFWPFQDSLLHDMASVTKSVTSVLVGIAIGRHPGSKGACGITASPTRTDTTAGPGPYQHFIEVWRRLE